jgi:hypothetical protein
LKLKNDHPLLKQENVNYHRNHAISANNTDQSIKKLRVKHHKIIGGESSQTKENTGAIVMLNEFRSERDLPAAKVEKVVVIKKSKIRKFMKLK